MFPWSVVFSLEPKVPGQRTPEELVTNTFGAFPLWPKRTERIQLEKAAETRRRRNSSSADYSWLAGPQPHVPYELTPGDVLELQDLCAQIPPQQCGPVIVRFRKLLSEFEAEVHDVPKLFRGVLRNCLDELQGDAELENRVNRWEKQRSKSLSFVTFRSKFRTLNRGKGSFGGSRNDLQEENTWSDEDEEAAAMRTRKGRSLSMPEITPLEQAAQRLTKGRDEEKDRGKKDSKSLSWQWRRKKRGGGKEQEKGRKSDSRRHLERLKLMLSDCKTNTVHLLIEPKNTGLIFFFFTF
uniref:Protein RD3-like n=1 Tax=Sinocyclocheilus rhinocerous TaxID=307959 RepID=A0A673L0Z2_9TELE